MQILLNNISKSGFVTRSSLDHMLRKVLGILQDQNSAEDQKLHYEEEAARRARLRKERFAKPPSRKQVKALKNRHPGLDPTFKITTNPTNLETNDIPAWTRSSGFSKIKSMFQLVCNSPGFVKAKFVNKDNIP